MGQGPWAWSVCTHYRLHSTLSADRVGPTSLLLDPLCSPSFTAAPSLNDAAVREFHDALAKSSDMAVAVAAIKALTTVIRLSTGAQVAGVCVAIRHIVCAGGQHSTAQRYRRSERSGKRS